MLTTDQLQAIDRHLRKENWLLNEELITELTDHYINGISERLTHGMVFDVALREIHGHFGGRPGLLKMEEAYQTQKARQFSLAEWCEVQTFFVTKRAFITLFLFSILYYLNTVAEQQGALKYFFSFSNGIVLAALLGTALVSIIDRWRRYKYADVSIYFTRNASTPFIRLYALCYILLFSNKFLALFVHAELSDSVQLWIITLTQTMVIAYLMGSVLALRKLFIKKPKTARTPCSRPLKSLPWTITFARQTCSRMRN